jgi:hypothetical protein
MKSSIPSCLDKTVQSGLATTISSGPDQTVSSDRKKSISSRSDSETVISSNSETFIPLLPYSENPFSSDFMKNSISSCSDKLIQSGSEATISSNSESDPETTISSISDKPISSSGSKTSVPLQSDSSSLDLIRISNFFEYYKRIRWKLILFAHFSTISILSISLRIGSFFRERELSRDHRFLTGLGLGNENHYIDLDSAS